MRIHMLAGLLAGGLWVPVLAAQSAAQQQVPQPSASDGGKVEVQPARPVAETADELNGLVTTATVDGLVLAVTIDRATVTLNSVVLARVPRSSTGADRKVAGDVVRATAYINNEAVATTVTPDNVVNASEGEGLVRTERRQIVIALASDRPIERVEIDAPATGARATLDVRAAYAEFCKADPAGKWCPRNR
jgi:hypothetical protein